MPFWHKKSGKCEIRPDLGSLPAGWVPQFGRQRHFNRRHDLGYLPIHRDHTFRRAAPQTESFPQMRPAQHLKHLTAISRYLSGYVPKDDQPLFQGKSNEAGLARPWNLGVMNYAPTNEQGVVALFVCHMKALGFEKLEFIRQGFPDVCVLQQKGETFSRKFVEFEFRSSQFRQYVQDDTRARAQPVEGAVKILWSLAFRAGRNHA